MKFPKYDIKNPTSSNKNRQERYRYYCFLTNISDVLALTSLMPVVTQTKRKKNENLRMYDLRRVS